MPNRDAMKNAAEINAKETAKIVIINSVPSAISSALVIALRDAYIKGYQAAESDYKQHFTDKITL